MVLSPRSLRSNLRRIKSLARRHLPFLSVMGVDGGVGGGLLPVFGGGNRLRDGLGAGPARLLKLLATSNSLLILTPPPPPPLSVESRLGDGGVAGGGLLNMSDPRVSNTPPLPPPMVPASCGCGDGSSYSSLRPMTPDDDVDDADEDEIPFAPVGAAGGVGGVDDESKKLRLKSEVVSKLTSVVTW